VRPHHLISSLVVLAAAASALAGCGGESDASAPAPAPPAAAAESSSGGNPSAVKVDDFKFTPATLTVKSGDGIAVTNDDSTAHTATADDGKAFDTGALDPGATQTITLDKPGTYPFHCSIHPFMKGKIVVG